MQGNECTQNLKRHVLNAVCKSPRMKVYKMTPIYLRVISAHGNTSTDNDLSKSGALFRPGKWNGLKTGMSDFWKSMGMIRE